MMFPNVAPTLMAETHKIFPQKGNFERDSGAEKEKNLQQKSIFKTLIESAHLQTWTRRSHLLMEQNLESNITEHVEKQLLLVNSACVTFTCLKHS